MRLATTISGIFLAIMLGVMPSLADRRVALVIGNAGYRNVVPLDNPGNDAKLIADTLQNSLGFTLVGGGPQLDLDRASLNRVVREFGAQLLGADVGLFYYAGHGVQVRGENYLVPVDANPTREADAYFEMLDAAVVLSQMEASGAHLKLVILDACRNNPFNGRTLAVGRGRDNEPIRLRDMASGLLEMAVPEGTLVSFAAQPGSVARDGNDGNSPYTKALASAMQVPGLGIFDTFNQVSLQVSRVTGGSQRPWMSSSSINGVFYFVPSQTVAAPQPTAPAPAIIPQPSAAATAWSDIKDTNSIAVLELFVRRFGDSFYGDLARLRIEELKKQQTAAITPPVVQAAPSQQDQLAPAVVTPPAPVTTMPPPDIDDEFEAYQSANPFVLPVVPPSAPIAPLSFPTVPPPQELLTPSAVTPPALPPVQSDPCSGIMTVAVSTHCGEPLTATQERALKPKDTFKECVHCPEMVVVPAGSVRMGSPANEKDRKSDEGPQHVVSFGRPFAVGRFHVTVDQFAAFVAATGYDAASSCRTLEDGKYSETSGRSWRNPGFQQDGLHPAVCLRWNDAKAYVDWLAQTTGKGYRLLTEAEWEYAARGRTSVGSYPRYSFGNNEETLCRYGNGADQAAISAGWRGGGWAISSCYDGYAYTAPVGSFKANSFDLHDMQGNAWQWTEDCYHDSYQGAPKNGSAWITDDCSRRVLRGGSWSSDPVDLRTGYRLKALTGFGNNDYGFRVARTLAAP